jgi:hypothetical protein
MSAVRVFQNILPSSVFPWNNGGDEDASNKEDGRLLKRRKTQIAGRGPFHATVTMESNLSCTSTSSSDSSDDFLCDDDILMDGSAIRSGTGSSPGDSFAIAIQNRGIPSRLDPLSIDHFVYFESAEDESCGELPQAMPLELVTAMDHPRIHQQEQIEKLQTYGTPAFLKSLRTPDGETLLHLAASSGCHAVVEKLLRPDMQLPIMVLDRTGRTPLHSLCMTMKQPHSHATQQQFLETMRVLVLHSPTLVLYMDQERMTPLQYIHSTYHKQVNNLLLQENVVDRVAQEISRQLNHAHSGQRLTAMETIDRMVNLSGVDAAIMETGFSI